MLTPCPVNQAPATAPAINPASIEMNPDDYVAPRFSRKIKSKVYIHRKCQRMIVLFFMKVPKDDTKNEQLLVNTENPTE